MTATMDMANSKAMTDTAVMKDVTNTTDTTDTTEMTGMTDHDRSAIINIGSTDFELILTTRATKLIAKRYGGLQNLGDKLLKEENFELALDEIVYLITLLANQSVQIHNLRNRDDKKELLTEEEVELLTSPHELAEYKSAITEAMFKGMKRNIVSEDESSAGAAGQAPKNTTAG